MTSDSTDRADAAADFADGVFAGEPWTVSALARAIAERDARLRQRERDRMAGLLAAALRWYHAREDWLNGEPRVYSEQPYGEATDALALVVAEAAEGEGRADAD